MKEELRVAEFEINVFFAAKGARDIEK